MRFFTRRARLPGTNIPAIPVKFNCPANWQNMRGGDRVRHCTNCDRKVYNLSDMTSFEARSLLLREERKICVRYHLRPDGMVMTRDCGLGVRARFKTRLALAAVLGVLGFVLMPSTTTGARISPKALARMKAREARILKAEREEEAAEHAADIATKHEKAKAHVKKSPRAVPGG